MFFVYLTLGQSVSSRFYNLHHSFSNPKLAACVYILIFLGIFWFIDLTAYLLNLIKSQGDQRKSKIRDKGLDNLIFFQLPALTGSAFFIHQIHSSEFDFLSLGILTFSTLFALGLVTPIRKLSDATYLKFSKFFQKYSLFCRVLLYTLIGIISVFIFFVLLSSESFILRVLAVFGIS